MSGNWLALARACVPRLGGHKGQAGRIAVVGGSVEYTGAPYFAAIAALKVGADLAHVICTERAAPVIKSYSPELIVHPILDADDVSQIESWLERIHVVVVGPGLGRDPKILRAASQIIKHCRNTRKPLVIDADGLYMVTQNIDLIKDYPPPGVILTPNKIEFERLYEVIKSSGPTSIYNGNEEIKIDYNKLGDNVLILRKGSTDETFCVERGAKWTNGEGGSARRCGGQGDLLSGSTATFFHWCINNCEDKAGMKPAAIASYAAAYMTRRCNEKAFRVNGRSAVCSDMIEKIHEAFEELYERKN